MHLFIKEINKRGFKSFLYSSGTLPNGNTLCSINQNYLEYLVDCGLSGISFSIYSLGSYHDYVTGYSGSLDILIETIKNIYNIKNLQKELSFLPLKSNYKEISNIIKFAREWNISKINILKFIYQGRAKYGFFQREALSNEEEREFLGLLRENLISSVDVEISKLYDCDSYDGLLKSPFSAGVDEIFVASNLAILDGRRFRDYASN